MEIEENQKLEQEKQQEQQEKEKMMLENYKMQENQEQKQDEQKEFQKQTMDSQKQQQINQNQNQQKKLDFSEILGQFFAKIKQELKKGFKSEQIQGLEQKLIKFNEGYCINIFTKIMSTMLKDHHILDEFKKGQKEFRSDIIKCVIIIVNMKKKTNSNCQQILTNFQDIFHILTNEKQEDKMDLLRDLVKILGSDSIGMNAQNFLLKQIFNMVLPKNNYEEIKINLSLHPTQTEYMPKPVQISCRAKEIGKYMKDALEVLKKDKSIQSQLQGLDLDLLVSNKIIANLDLKIQTVYKKVFLKSYHNQKLAGFQNQDKLPVMKIIYKGRGIDGEAQEEQIDNLVDDEEQNTIQLCQIFSENISGEYIPDIKVGEDNEFIEKLLALIDEMLNNGDKQTLQHRVQMRKKSESLENNINLNQIAKKSIRDIEFVFKFIKQLEENKVSKEYVDKKTTEFNRLLPLLTYNLELPSKHLINKFKDSLNFLDNTHILDKKSKIHRFIDMLEYVPEYYSTFKTQIINQDIIKQCVQQFNNLIPHDQEIDQEQLEKNKETIQAILKFFYCLLKGSEKIQKVLNQSQIFQKIIKLAEPSIKVQNIGKISESIIKYITDENSIVDKEVYQKVNDIQLNLKKEKQRKALEKQKKKQQALKAKAMNIKNKFSHFLLDEEKELSICKICKEGYNTQKEQLLGIYVYMVDDGEFYEIDNFFQVIDEYLKQSQDQNQNVSSLQVFDNIKILQKGLSSVSSMNFIHFDCHNNAVQQYLNQNNNRGKTEWEAAQASNPDTLCNNLFPIKGKVISQEKFNEGVKKYVDALYNDRKIQQFTDILRISKRNCTNNFTTVWVMLMDISELIKKMIVNQEIFKQYSTAIQYNMEYFVNMFGSINYLISITTQKIENLKKIKDSLISLGKMKGINDHLSFQFLFFILVQSLFVLNYKEWRDNLQNFVSLIAQNFGVKSDNLDPNSEHVENIQNLKRFNYLIQLLCFMDYCFTHVHQNIQVNDQNDLNKLLSDSICEQTHVVIQKLQALIKDLKFEFPIEVSFKSYLKKLNLDTQHDQQIQMNKGQQPAAGGKFVKNCDAVADDRNWIARIDNEMNCTHSWQKDWGFLAGGTNNLDIENATKPYSVQEQIDKIQQQIEDLNQNKKLETTSREYGKGSTLERFQTGSYNIHKNSDLRPLERRLPKGWTKKPLKIGDDPYDPLTKMYGKKK
ncbi:hypothetical protein PPERSA_10251 [Pseudocohnilembus persalinus]|uniref:E3 ubiquitin ligase UBR4 C-terminal domain-containing protein n=1 Tax=Pseudocohnilembus persalinus TaxID=266149 RepID=A0A0V0QZX8_PSEPJ|nr:hypothetical protein PPERSA_10251 [Pseudocohnilembus persalinus]|eukprot:KRX07863.1 hypothetical protein PPERSA_10251 [Pseudocohnilembus persalinus]